ncbi:MAG: dTMP kinase [Balneolaceae bacterium]|nr:MAG: dTMP kinase [Balneolaceae bacterium]
MLITFEGIDGCGKSTQIDLLKKYLDTVKAGYSVLREPGGTEISEKIRSLLLHDSGDMDPVTELLLFSAARSQLIREKVIPLLNENKIVILDRFFDSTTAYQGYGRKSADLESIFTLNRMASHQVTPRLTFYLRITPEMAARRTQNSQKDRMERSGIDFFKRVVEGYDELAKKEDRFLTIDATNHPQAIHRQIIGLIGDLQQYQGQVSASKKEPEE